MAIFVERISVYSNFPRFKEILQISKECLPATYVLKQTWDLHARQQVYIEIIFTHVPHTTSLVICDVMLPGLFCHALNRCSAEHVYIQNYYLYQLSDEIFRVNVRSENKFKTVVALRNTFIDHRSSVSAACRHNAQHFR